MLLLLLMFSTENLDRDQRRNLFAQEQSKKVQQLRIILYWRWRKSKLENPLSFFKFVRVIMAAVSSFYIQTIYSVLVWMLFYTFGTNSFQALKQMMLQLDHERHLKLDAFERVEDLQRQVIGHFRVPNNLTFQTARLNAKPFVGKWVLFARKCKILFISIASNSASFWNRGLGQPRMAYSFVN